MTARRLIRAALAVLTAAALYNAIDDRGLRNTRPAVLLLGDLPHCRAATK